MWQSAMETENYCWCTWWMWNVHWGDTSVMFSSVFRNTFKSTVCRKVSKVCDKVDIFPIRLQRHPTEFVPVLISGEPTHNNHIRVVDGKAHQFTFYLPTFLKFRVLFSFYHFCLIQSQSSSNVEDSQNSSQWILRTLRMKTTSWLHFCFLLKLNGLDCI